MGGGLPPGSGEEGGVRLAPGKQQPLPEDVPYELVELESVGAWRLSPGRKPELVPGEKTGEFRLLKREWMKDPESGKMRVEHRFWDGAPGDFASREEARLWCECAGIDFDREVLENG